MKWIIGLLVLLLVVLHQDFWWWGDKTLVLGFVPIGLAWHVGISLAAAFVWGLAVKFCWPSELENVQENTEQTGGKASGEGH